MLRYVHHTPKSASGRSHLPGENMRSGPALVNNGAARRSANGVKREELNVSKSRPLYPR
jgi:hypothetical protein